MKIIKKVSAMTLVVIFMFILAVNSFAYNQNQQYTYYYPNGNSVMYYLDDAGNPYVFENGEKIYIALPLEHLKVTDENLIFDLNQSINNNSQQIQPYSVPTSYFDLSTGAADDASISYTVNNVSLANGVLTAFSILKFNPHHQYVCFKTDIIDKAFLAGNKVTLTYFYYNIYDDAWYNSRYEGVKCTSTFGYAIKSDFNVCPYGRFSIVRYSDIYTVNVSIWTTWNRQT